MENLDNLKEILDYDMYEISKSLKTNEDSEELQKLMNVYKLALNVIKIQIELKNDKVRKKNNISKLDDFKLIGAVSDFYKNKEIFENHKLDFVKEELQKLMSKTGNLENIMKFSKTKLQNDSIFKNLSNNISKKNIDVSYLNKLEYNMYSSQKKLLSAENGENSEEAKFIEHFLRSFFPEAHNITELPSNEDIKKFVSSTKSYKLRNIYTKKSWAILTKETISIIVDKIVESKKTKILDIGSGSGALVYWIRKELEKRNITNIEVIGIDDNSWGMTNTPVTKDILNGDALEYVKENKGEEYMYLGSWISPNSDFAYNILKEMEINSNFLYLGEGAGGCTGTPMLHSGLNYVSENKETNLFKIISFKGINDNIVEYKKRKEINEKFEKLFLSENTIYGSFEETISGIIENISEIALEEKINIDDLKKKNSEELMSTYEELIEKVAETHNKPEFLNVDISKMENPNYIKSVLSGKTKPKQQMKTH